MANVTAPPAAGVTGVPAGRGPTLAMGTVTAMEAKAERRTILLTGATGYVGGRLLPELLARGHEVRLLARRPERVARLDGGVPVPVLGGDAVSGRGLREALEGADVAYYLIHSMGRGSGPTDEFAERDRRAARNFAEAARAAGVRRIVYLGGLGPTGAEASEHLRSRHEVAQLLGELSDDLVYVRAAMVIGAGSASFEMLRSLVQRLPAMICPRWIDTRTQPIAIRDVTAALAAAADARGAPGEVQLGGPDTLTYREMMERFAAIVHRRAPVIVRVPVLTPRLSSYWVSLVTPVEAGLARPLIDGLKSEMLVDAPPPPGLNDDPLGFDDAVREALAERP